MPIRKDGFRKHFLIINDITNYDETEKIDFSECS